ncbi:MAG: Ig-like domain-containing protein [Evtepia sp.]|uniref:Ig-like domain-containing protein n=1 Tax=Evtepia sp. TaxID=2773933 RepID=UPI002A763E68|nr:Ig-like domain-containing protein [Evtepia sp.]MDY3014689.1 Ig-like domain-containing protein [Evtepia sp.]
METKQITLRSQTVRCLHCGEYYSVTYKYCPFCDAGRQEEERRQAEKKQKKKNLVNSLFGAPAKGEKNGKGEKRPRPDRSAQEKREESAGRRERSPEYKEHRERKEPSVSSAAPARKKESPRTEPAPVKETASQRDWKHRRKTSELNEEEKAARLAERAARAAQRKRERDRAAREAALAAGPKVEAGPVFEEDTVPETFGFTTEESVGSADPAAYAQTPVSAEGPVMVSEPAGTELQDIPVFIPEEMKQEAAQANAAQDQADANVWAEMKELEMADLTEAGGEIQTLPEVPEIPTEIEVEGALVEEAAPSAEPAQPAAQQTVPAGEAASADAAPAAAAPAQETPAVETDEDLDALLKEIRGLLVESPVPQLGQEELTKPAEPEPETQVDPADGAPLEADPTAAAPIQTGEEPLPQPEEIVYSPVDEEPAPVEEAQENWVEDEMPTQVFPAQDQLSAEDQSPMAERYEEPAEEPTRVMETEAVQAVYEEADETVVYDDPYEESYGEPYAYEDDDQSAAEETAADQAATQVWDAAPVQEEERTQAKQRKKAPKERRSKEKKKSRVNPFLIILSLVIVVAAGFIVVKTVVPVFQSGILSQQKEEETQAPKDTAEIFTLDNTDLNFSEKGAKHTLAPTFAPEGSTATLTWTTSDEKVATVDANGVVTTVGPGTATITASMENGQKAECVVRCTWTDETPQPTGDPVLSSTDVTLDGEGKTIKLQVNNATGAVTWESQDATIAKVAEDGTVTAVGKGKTTVVAKMGDKTFKCEIRCIW